MAVLYQNLEGYIAWPGFMSGSGSPNLNDDILDADGEMQGYVVFAPAAGTIDELVFHTGAVAQSPANGLRISFQGVDITTGHPNGVESHFVVKAGPFGAKTTFESGLVTDDGTGTGTKKTVTNGEMFAIVIEFEGFAGGDDIDIRDRQNASISSAGHMGGAKYHKFGGTWAANGSASLNILLKYDDGTYVAFTKAMGAGSPCDNNLYNLFDVNTTPDEVGILFTAPYNCKLEGFLAWTGERSETADVKLYDSADVVLDTLAYGTEWVTINARNTVQSYYFRFAGGVELTAGDDYRITFLPDTDTGVGHILYKWVYDHAKYMAHLSDAFMLTTRTNGGGWTDTDTDIPCVSLLFSDVESGGADGPKYFDC